jgi:hypothetical protein
MKIAQLASLWMSVPPSTYGGAERITHLLTEELVRRGHDVTLFAAAGSQTSANLVPVCPEPLTAMMSKGVAWEHELRSVLDGAICSYHNERSNRR